MITILATTSFIEKRDSNAPLPLFILLLSGSEERGRSDMSDPYHLDESCLNESGLSDL